MQVNYECNYTPDGKREANLLVSKMWLTYIALQKTNSLKVRFGVKRYNSPCFLPLFEKLFKLTQFCLKRAKYIVESVLNHKFLVKRGGEV